MDPAVDVAVFVEDGSKEAQEGEGGGGLTLRPQPPRQMGVRIYSPDMRGRQR